MVTVEASPAMVFAVGGLSSSVAVAVGALVVVLAIVLVFIMVLRSNGAARKSARGLGFDAQHGPLGQPQPDAASPWQRQGMQQPGWPQDGDFASGGHPGAAPAGRMPSAGWGQTQDYPGGAGGQAAAAQGQRGWGAPQGQGGWNDVSGQAPAPAWPGGAEGASGDQWSSPAAGSWGAPQAASSRPPAPAAASPWDAPAAGGAQSPWGAPSGQPAAPWDSPAASAPPAWGSASGAGAQPDWGSPIAPAPSVSRPPAQQAPAGQFGWDAAPPAPTPQGAGFDNAGFGEDKTRVVRPNTAQRPGMIVVRQGKEPGRIFEMRKDRLTIGRSRESDIFLEDLAVSRLHTTVGRDEAGRYILRDENSANGTYVNGQRVTEHVLEEGDEVQVGQTVLAFVRR